MTDPGALVPGLSAATDLASPPARPQEKDLAWATVYSLSPLQVVFAQDDVPVQVGALIVGGTSVTTALTVGEKVGLLRFGGRWFAIGVIG